MANPEDPLALISAAHARISNFILETPLIESKWLSQDTGCNIFLKMESEQYTGSFKLRGATNKLKLLSESSDFKGDSVVTASSGNHALACAYASSQLGINMKIFSYLNMSKSKEEMLSLYKNVELLKYGDNCCVAEMHARSEANKDNLTYISPYNDIEIIHGQGTIGLELLSQKKNLDAVLVTVGGGGLISGIALYMKLINPNIRVIACQPVNDACMYESIKSGHIVEDNVFHDTISDGSAGRIEPGAVTFDIIQQYVDEWVLLEEGEIEQAIYDLLVHHNKVIEGAAGCVIAGVRKIKDKLQGLNVALVMCGANLGVKNLNYIVKKYS